MKVISYIGIDAEAITITQPTDIYVILDWTQSRMIENQEKENGLKNIEKWEKAIHYLSNLMEQVEIDGFGSIDDVDKIEY